MADIKNFGIVGVGGTVQYGKGGGSLKWDTDGFVSTSDGTTLADLDAAGVNFTGLSGTGSVTVTNILDEDNMASDSATALATQQSIKAYVDAQVGGGTLSGTGDSGAFSVNLASNTFGVFGGTNLTSTGSGSNVTIALDSNISLTSVTASGTVQGGTLTDGTASLTGGDLTGAGDITATGTVTGGTLTDGTLSSTGGTITGGVAATFSGAVTGGSITDGTATLSSGTITGGVGATFSGTVDAGTVEFDNLSGTGSITVTDIIDDDTMGTASNTTLATSESIKAYVDAQTHAGTLDIQGDSGSGSIDLLTQVLDVAGGTNLTSVASGQTITVNLDNSISLGNVTASGTVQGGSLTDGTATLSSGALSGATTVTASGTITGGSLTDGTATLSSGALTGATTGSFSGNVSAGNISATDGTFSGSVTFGSGSGGTLSGLTSVTAQSVVATSNIVLNSYTVTDILDEDNMASDSDTALATQQSIKAYVDSQIGASSLDIQGDSGSGNVDLDSQTLDVAGGTNITTSASGQTITVNLDNSISLGNVTASGTVQGGTLTDGTLSSTSGTITGGVAATFSGAVQGGSLTDGTATLSSGSLTGGVNGTFSGTVTGGTLTDGTLSSTGGTITGGVAATFSGTVTGGTLTDGTASISSGAITGATNITASGTITGGTLTDGTLSSTGGTITGGVAATFSGAVTGGSLTDGTATLSSGALTGATTGSFSGTVTAGNLNASGGTVTFGSLSDGTLTMTAILDEDNMASDSDTALATQQSIKAYVDSQTGALSTSFLIQGDSGSGNITLATDTLDIAGTANEIETSYDNGTKTLTIGLPNDVTIAGNATISGTLLSDDITASTVAITGDMTVTGDTVMTGNLTVNGNTTIINSNTIQSGDAIIVLNADLPSGTAPSLNSGWEVNRGSSANVEVLWLEGVDYFIFQDENDVLQEVRAGTFNASTFTGGSYTGANATLTGDVSFGTLTDSGESITITKFVDEADGIGANDNDTTIPTSAAVKDYVDNNAGDGNLLRNGSVGTGSSTVTIATAPSVAGRTYFVDKVVINTSVAFSGNSVDHITIAENAGAGATLVADADADVTSTGTYVVESNGATTLTAGQTIVLTFRDSGGTAVSPTAGAASVAVYFGWV